MQTEKNTTTAEDLELLKQTDGHKKVNINFGILFKY